MCKLLIAEKQVGRNPELYQLINGQFDDFKAEKDGAGAFILTDEGKVIVYKDMKNYSAVFDFVNDNFEHARLIGVHSRTGTTGDKDETNIHFFEIADAFMAHNGIVPKYTSYNRSKAKSPSGNITYAGKSDSGIYVYGQDGRLHPYHREYVHDIRDEGVDGYYDEQSVWHGYPESTVAIQSRDPEVNDEPSNGVPSRDLSHREVLDVDEKASIFAEMSDIVDETITCKGCQSSNEGTCKKHKRAFQKRAVELGYAVEKKKTGTQISIPLGEGKKVAVDIRPEVSELEDGTKIITKMSDTWHFLNYLPRPINKASIEKHMTDTSFWGMGFIWDTKKKKAWIFAKNKDCKVIHRTTTTKKYSPYTCITSYDPTVEWTTYNYLNVAGLLVKGSDEEEKLDIEPLDMIEGVYELKVD